MMTEESKPVVGSDATREMPAARKQTPGAAQEPPQPTATDEEQQTSSEVPEGPGGFAKEDPVVLHQVEVATQDGPVEEDEPSGNWKVVTPILHNGQMILPGDSVSAGDLESDEVPYSGEDMLRDLVNSGAVVPEEVYQESSPRQVSGPQEGEVWVNYQEADNRPASVGGSMGDVGTARYAMDVDLPQPINVPKSEEQTGTSVRTQPSPAREITNRNNG